MGKKRSNGEGSVRRNVTRNRWEGRISLPDGRRRMVTAKTRQELSRRMRAAQDSDDSGQLTRADLTVGRWLTSWLDEVLPGTVSPATEGQYRDVVRLYLIPRIGRKRLVALSPTDVDAMLHDMAIPTSDRPDGYSPTARRLARAVLRRALRRAEHEGLVRRNVAALSSSVRQERVEGRSMEMDQARRFLDAAAHHRLHAALVVGLVCGLRLAEIVGLAWDMVQLDDPHPRLLVRRSLKRIAGRGLVLGDVKTNRSRRTVHLTALAADSLRAHRSGQEKQRQTAGETWIECPHGADLVFRTEFGAALDPSTVARAVSDTSIAAGLGHWTPHELRHSAASLLLSSGVPLVSVANYLGHSSATVTASVYAHMLDGDRPATTAAMENVLG